MTGYRSRWILAAILWGLACVAFIIDVDSAAGYRKYRSEVETLETLRGFIAEHRRDIEDSRLEAATLRQEVESVDFGLLYLESRLAGLAHTLALDKFEFVLDKEGNTTEGLRTISVKVAGGLRDAVQLIDTIERTYPYLMVQGAEAAADTAVGGLNYTLRLNYYYKVKASDI